MLVKNAAFPPACSFFSCAMTFSFSLNLIWLLTKFILKLQAAKPLKILSAAFRIHGTNGKVVDHDTATARAAEASRARCLGQHASALCAGSGALHHLGGCPGIYDLLNLLGSHVWLFPRIKEKIHFSPLNSNKSQTFWFPWPRLKTHTTSPKP